MESVVFFHRGWILLRQNATDESHCIPSIALWPFIVDFPIKMVIFHSYVMSGRTEGCPGMVVSTSVGSSFLCTGAVFFDSGTSVS